MVRIPVSQMKVEEGSIMAGLPVVIAIHKLYTPQHVQPVTIATTRMVKGEVMAAMMIRN